MSQRWSVLEVACVVVAGLAGACGGEGMSADGSDGADDVMLEGGMSSDESVASQESGEGELGTAEQPLAGLLLPSSCGDITGTDPVLAALAVSTATELRR